MPPTASVLSRWRQCRRPLVAVALTAALMLLTAPLRTMITGCDLCPPDCPMHAHRAAAANAHGDTPRMHCHNAPARPTASGGGTHISRPPCGSHVALTGLDLAPMLPAGPPAWMVTPRIAGSEGAHAFAGGRTGDPPDAPPPDARA